MGSENTRIGFIGGGNMAKAIGEAIVKNALCKPSDIWVSGPRLENLQQWKEWGTNISNKNGDVFHYCNTIFLGVKPQILDTAIKDCLDTLHPSDKKAEIKSKLFISMLAGVTLATLQETLKSLPANSKVIRIMPNTPMLVEAGACLYTPGNNVNAQECQFIENILDSCGLYEKVSEPLLNSLGSLTGCGPAFIYLVIEALADGAVKQGAPRALAARMAAQTVVGAGRLVLQSGLHPGELKDQVCSPGGSTICGVTELERGNVRASFINAIEAASRRAGELGRSSK